MSPLLRHLVSAGARRCQGRSSSGLTALRGLHLDSACAPAVIWQLRRSEDRQDQPNQSVHAFRGTPFSASFASGEFAPNTCGTSGRVFSSSVFALATVPKSQPARV